MRRRALALAATLATLTTAGAGSGVALAAPTSATGAFVATSASVPSTESGAVQTVTLSFPDGTTSTLSVAQLEALPRTTITAADGSTVSGVALPTLAATGSVPTDGGKNAQLRTSYVVTGTRGDVQLAGGEQDAGFGNHPALLTENPRGRVDLVVPQDKDTRRSVVGVRSVEVGFTSPGATPAPSPGGITIATDDGVGTLSAAQLAALPQQQASVTFLAGTTSETHTEQGPTLRKLLAAAGIPVTASTLVTSVGSDGYAASVTLGEESTGGRRLGLSLVEDGVALAQPRLVVIGDLKGGRYVSAVTRLVVAQG